jgi:integrase
LTVAALRGHKERHAEDQATVGPGWQDSGLVFTHPDGAPIHPDLISDWFERLAREAGLPKIRLHDVRHSYASAALAACHSTLRRAETSRWRPCHSIPQESSRSRPWYCLVSMTRTPPGQ